MKVLIVAEEAWNDNVWGNGVLTNWFSGLDVETAMIYCSPGLPLNKICHRYFQLTDGDMLKSLFSFGRAGREVESLDAEISYKESRINENRRGVYGFFKKLSLVLRTPVVMLRDLIWKCGRIDEPSLSGFIKEFNPDVVFCPRLIDPRLMKIERTVCKFTDAPIVAFTGDREVWPLPGYSHLLSRIRTCYINKTFERHIKRYSYYLMHSGEQAESYKRDYGVSTDTFYKCGNFGSFDDKKKVGNPIRMVYAGRLYCNRWMTLAEIGKALKRINGSGTKMVLDIYTSEELTEEQKKALCSENSIFVKGSVPASELVDIYKNADIALHVESMDRYNVENTRYSFSTKIIDLMNSSCAILAICKDVQTGFRYLKDHDAAICVSDYKEIYNTLQDVCDHPEVIAKYALKAFECGKANHTREVIQGKLLSVFETVIKNSADEKIDK